MRAPAVKRRKISPARIDVSAAGGPDGSSNKQLRVPYKGTAKTVPKPASLPQGRLESRKSLNGQVAVQTPVRNGVSGNNVQTKLDTHHSFDDIPLPPTPPSTLHEPRLPLTPRRQRRQDPVPTIELGDRVLLPIRSQERLDLHALGLRLQMLQEELTAIGLSATWLQAEGWPNRQQRQLTRLRNIHLDWSTGHAADVAQDGQLHDSSAPSSNPPRDMDAMQQRLDALLPFQPRLPQSRLSSLPLDGQKPCTVQVTTMRLVWDRGKTELAQRIVFILAGDQLTSDVAINVERQEILSVQMTEDLGTYNQIALPQTIPAYGKMIGEIAEKRDRRRKCWQECVEAFPGLEQEQETDRVLFRQRPVEFEITWRIVVKEEKTVDDAIKSKVNVPDSWLAMDGGEELARLDGLFDEVLSEQGTLAAIQCLVALLFPAVDADRQIPTKIDHKQ